MRTADVLIEGFGRIREVVDATVDGLSVDRLTWRVDAEANTIGWLVWHLTRIQDDHVADVFGTEQVWTANGWFERFELPFEASATGYGHSTDAVGAVRVDADHLTGYHAAVAAATIELLSNVTDDDLDRVVDDRWDPPVTMGVRLISVISDDLQHVGQAGFVRGAAERAR